MAVFIKTEKAQELLALLKDKCNSDVPCGARCGWLVDQDGDFVIGAEFEVAWLKPYVTDDALVFGLIGRRDREMGCGTYARYHSGMIDLVLTHYDGLFSEAYATAKKDSRYDKFH